MNVKAVVNVLLEADESDSLKDFALQSVEDRRRRLSVSAVIVSDTTGQKVKFDARAGLDNLKPPEVEELQRSEFQRCRAADKVADFADDARVLDVIDSGPYEVYVNAAEAARYLPVRRHLYLGGEPL